MYASQFEYENALPVDPPEPPNMDGEIGDLMTGDDTCLVSYNAFRQSAEEDMYKIAPDAFLVDFILAANRSSDPVMKGKAREAFAALEDHAGAMLGKAWMKRATR